MEKEYAVSRDGSSDAGAAGVDDERGFGRGDAGERREGAGEDGSGFEAGFTHGGLVLLEDVARDRDGEDAHVGLGRAHDLEADHGVLNLKGHELFEAEAHHGQRLGELGGQCVEVEQEDADGGVGEDDGELGAAAVGADINRFQCPADGGYHGDAVREIAGFETGRDGSGSQRDARDGFEWALSGERARSRHALGGDLAGEARTAAGGFWEQVHREALTTLSRDAGSSIGLHRFCVLDEPAGEPCAGLTSCFNEGYLVDLAEGGDAGADALKGGVAQEVHPLLAGLFADFGAGALLEEHLADLVVELQELMDGGAAAVAGAGALDAAGALPEAEAAPLGGVEAVKLKLGVGVGDLAAAEVADGPDETLGEDAVECGDEVVGLNAHVEEAAEDVDDVVGVDSGEDEVAGERGVDGDLRGLGVADFADEDLVGVVAEDRAQAACEGEALFLVDWDLSDAADLVLDRVFDGDDLVLFGLDLVERGVERGGFTGAGGAGDEHHAVGLLDVAAEAAEVFFCEADDVEREVVELLGHRLLVEHAEHGVFAVDGRHDAHA